MIGNHKSPKPRPDTSAAHLSKDIPTRTCLLSVQSRNQTMTEEVNCATRWGAGLLKKIDKTGKFINVPYPLPPSCRDESMIGSPIQEFFRGANVLVTGATGFMGKILVEKLLASCPGIGKIYLIIREKKGQNSEERLKDLMSQTAFRRVQLTVPSYKDKVTAIHGDCSQPRLGLSETEYEKLTNLVNVVFHGAATVKFTEKLQDATLINVAGVREVLKFCRLCKNLKSVVHTSTAYTNCIKEHDTILEKFYPACKSYEEILKLAEENPEELNRQEAEILGPWPNTYSFTKKLAEDLIMKEGIGLPISVFRPGVVIASYQEPTPGWIDNIYGPTAVIVGSYLGAIRVISCNRKSRANLVPVDLAVNGIIAAAWKANNCIRKSFDEIPIYNYVSEARNPMTWGQFSQWNAEYAWNWPTMFSFWYPVLVYVKQPVAFAICFFLLHTVPAYVIDTVLWMSRKKPLMVATNQKIMKFYDLLSYFNSNSWAFKDSNVLELWEQLSTEDKIIYPFDIAGMDWDQHAQVHVLGLRVHVVKDPIETLDKARIKIFRLHLQHRFLQFLVVALFSWFIYQLF